MARRKKHEEPEEAENHERWLVTYADMVTLLMVLFIVMFSMSQVDQRKFNELKAGLAAAGFGDSSSILSNGTSIQQEAGVSSVPAVQPQMNAANLSEGEQEAVAKAIEDNADLARSRAESEVRVEAERLADVRQRLMSALREQGLESDVKATYDERGLVLSLVSRHIVFRAHRAELTPRGLEVVDALGPTLADLEDRLEIDGHTNQVKVAPKYYESDWDLSAARALTVLRRLQGDFAIPADRLTLAAFGHTKPLLPPSKPGSQQVNKRVDIVVLTALPPSTASMLTDPAKRGEQQDRSAPGNDGQRRDRPRDDAGTPSGEIRLAASTPDDAPTRTDDEGARP